MGYGDSSADHNCAPAVRELLLEARVRAGLTQHDLACRAGLSRRTVGDIERGSVARPRASSLQLLSRALGLSKDGTEELLLSAVGIRWQRGT
jgi:transcriptional regulator with XRE-family HTH domain